MGTIIAIVLIALAVYMLPSVIALARGHRNKGAVVAYNILGSWTIFGWFVALVWAIYREPSSI